MKKTTKTQFRSVKLSLRDIAGDDYADAVCRARAFASNEQLKSLTAKMAKKVDFYPKAFHEKMVNLLGKIGKTVTTPFKTSARGATTAAFAAATNIGAAPLSGFGHYRVGENGRLYLTTKSEHYHAPLGHAFPGYRLLDIARSLGIPNATHNNTRGHITRLLEEELIGAANEITSGGGDAFMRIAASREPAPLNRVLNLATGSLACEAAIKMVLGRFCRVQEDSPSPKYRDRIPVFVVMGDYEGSDKANYHGTTVLAQVLRGMWPEFKAALEEREIMLVRSVVPNDVARLEQVLGDYDSGRYKVAAFWHELVLMNYGAKVLSREFIRRAYDICRERDIPTVDDEIQSCIWSPDFFLYKEYGIRPDFVVIGKGFSGGEYPASRILFNSEMDTLPQFGALVTNGQEEFASLAYLITMRWARENAEVTREIGNYYEAHIREVAGRHARTVASVEGKRHLVGLHFHDLELAKRFTGMLNDEGLDISVQTYKSSCPPAALTKIPLTMGYEVVDKLVELMDGALSSIEHHR